MHYPYLSGLPLGPWANRMILIATGSVNLTKGVWVNQPTPNHTKTKHKRVHASWYVLWWIPLVLNPVFIVKTRSIPLLLMPWFFPSQNHQRPLYWLCRTIWSLFSTRKDYNYLHHQGPALLTWINFNCSMHEQSHSQRSMGRNYLSIQNFNGCTIKVLEYISNIIPNFVMDVITYPSWDLR